MSPSEQGIGRHQIRILEFMVKENCGLWFPGCRMNIGGKANMLRILESMRRRSLVSTNDGEDMYWATATGVDVLRKRGMLQ